MKPNMQMLSFHRRAYMACLTYNPPRAEEVRQFVLRVYGIDLAMEAK